MFEGRNLLIATQHGKEKIIAPIFEKEFPNLFYMRNVFRRTDEILDYCVKYPLWACLDKKRENHSGAGLCFHVSKRS